MVLDQISTVVSLGGGRSCGTISELKEIYSIDGIIDLLGPVLFTE